MGLRKGERQTHVSKGTGIAEGTLRGWLRDEEKLQSFVHELDQEKGLTRNRARLAKDAPLDQATLSWFVEQHAGVSLSGLILKAQAEKFSEMLNGDNQFSASQGRLWHITKV